MVRDSSLVTRLSRYATLTHEERDALDWVERRELRVAAGAKLVEEGSDNRSLFIVQTGWLHASMRLPQGGRQILGFHFAGDLMGTSGIAWLPAVHTLTAVSDSIVSELSKTHLGRLFRDQPRLGGILYAIAAAENVAMGDRLTAVARLGGVERLGTLLLDMLARLRVAAQGVVRSFDLPLTQSDIGDAVGLTKVHVSRMFGVMERDGLIQRQGRRITILDEARLIAQTGFVDRYAVIETDWLTAA